jgi:lipopolysaccharide exporter
MSDIRGQMARGAAWMVAFKLVERCLALTSTLVLARLLMPADFGLVAMAASLVAMLDLFSAFGLDVALIQRSGNTREHYDTAWTLNIVAGACVACLMLALAWPISWFYKEPRLVLVVFMLAPNAFVQGCENIGIVAFRKEMDFRKEFIFLFTRRLVGVTVTIPAAFILRNYWALIIGMLAGRLGGVALSFALHPFRPRLSLAKVGDFFHFSKWVVVQNLLSFLKERSADLIIGRLAGAHGLGVFNVSNEIASIPGTELIAPINRAVLPGYARLANDRPALRREFLSVMAIVAVVALPAVTGIACVAPFVVAAILGPKWHEATTVLAVLAFYGIFQALLSNAYSAFLAIGKPQTFVRITAVYVAIDLPLLLFLTQRLGVIGAAWAHVVAVVVTLPLSVMLVSRDLGLHVRDIAAEAWRPVLASAMMFVVVATLRPHVDVAALPSTDAVKLLALYVPLGAAVYCAAIFVLWVASGRPQGAEASLLRELGRRWGAVFAVVTAAFRRN